MEEPGRLQPMGSLGLKRERRVGAALPGAQGSSSENTGGHHRGAEWAEGKGSMYKMQGNINGMNFFSSTNLCQRWQ